VGFIFLIACVNVAGLLMARAARAEVDVAIRMALGAERKSIMRLFLSEALLLSIGGGALGISVAYIGVETIRRWGPANRPRLNEITMSTPVLLFTLACAVGAGLVFGVAPAFRSSRVELLDRLNSGGRSQGLGSHHRIQRVLVIAEVAIAVVLLNCSGLLLRTVTNLVGVDPGFEPNRRVAMQITLSSARYPDREQISTLLDELHLRFDGTPGIRPSGSSVRLPFQWQMWRKQTTVEDRPAEKLPKVPLIDLSISTPRYLETLGIRLIRGRSLSNGDGSEDPFVALVNEAFVRRNLPGEDAIGRRLRISPPDALLPPDRRPEDFPWYTIVGVVGS
jgi:putative ABC transport system permease protein